MARASLHVADCLPHCQRMMSAGDSIAHWTNRLLLRQEPIIASVATIEIKSSAVARLRPATHAITDGSLDPVPVTVRLGRSRSRGKLTLQVDRATARRFAIHRWTGHATTGIVLAIGGTSGILYASASPVIMDDPGRWSLLAVASAWLIGALHQSYLKPSVYPRLWRGTFRLRNVDDVAAGQWRDANDANVMSVGSDSPRRDALVRHGWPLALAIAVAVLVAGLA